MIESNHDVRKIFVKHIYKRMKEIITGSCVDRVYNDKPQIQFFAGTLCSQEPSSRLGSIRTKVAPVRMGVEFLIKKSEAKNASLIITPNASVFYKVNPSYQEQLNATMKKNEWNEETLKINLKKQSELAKNGEETCNLGAKPVSVFKKHKMNGVKLNCRLAEFMNHDFEGQLELPEVKAMIESAFDTYNSDDNAYRPKKNKKEEMSSFVPLSALVDEKSFIDFMKSWGEKDTDPSWDFKVYAKTTDFDKDKIKVSVAIENTCIAKENEYVDNFLFDTSIHVKAEGAKIHDFVIDYLNDHYRYDGLLGASGINCEAIKDDAENSVHSEHVPVFEQPRIKTRESIKPKFEDLASDKAIVVLKGIATSMKEYLDKEYIQEFAKREKKNEFKSEIGKKRFQEDIKIFENEIKRFEYGIEVLESHAVALKAFKMMNKTFANTGKSKASEKTYDSWRVFQIIFIVMNIPDVVSTEYKDVTSTFENVEVLYFPTGGGKTETYLGLSIFTLFFDRMRGKKFGTSVMMKFPLRLLSLQQIQRIANVLAQAELIRREDTSTNENESEEFSLGYFVGDRNTPNKLVNKSTIFGGEDKDLLTPIAEEREKILKGELQLDDENLEGRKYLIVSKCPFCGTKKIMIDADIQKIRLIHRCMNPDCKEDSLPVYISDMEIYRYVPSLIISTLDKIAICGLQKNFRNLFGQVTHKCPLHGYSNSAECTEKWLCKADKSKIETVTPYDSVPTIQIQDEMHLVRESLGTFDSHYESFLEQYEKQLTGNRRSMKILTATATIADYKMQTDHLYCKEAVQFPSQGPSLRESFYSQVDEDDLNRLIVGITPHYKTMIFSVLALIETYHRLIETYLSNPSLLMKETGLNLKDSQVREILEDYRIMLSYHQAKNDGDSISNSIRTMTNRFLRENELAEIKQRPLTGDVSFNDVRIVLDEIENPKTDEGRINLIIATSMISHGVDVDKLNFMVFMGMPRNTAEYIQASSRVGRKYPGLVFVIFNPTRERDQSYFKFFSKFHEYKDLLVEAVPINRWAKFSINRTLPGIFTGAVLNYFDIKSMPVIGKSINMSKPFEKAVSQNLVTEDEIREFLIKSYKIDKEHLGLGIEFKDIITKKVNSYVHEITQNLGNDFITKPMSEKPMMSLRDVDVPIDINLSPEGMMVLRNIKASRTVSYDDDEEDKEGDD